MFGYFSGQHFSKQGFSLMIKVLAFMCSRHRPLMLRNSILQMVTQTYPIDCCVYINSNLNEPDKTDYSSLLDDIKPAKGHRLFIKYGESFHQHKNHIEALSQINVDDYDLFLKIDDDDVYRLTYVNDIVEDFILNKWDLSGEFSNGVINGAQWRKEQVNKNMGLDEGSKDVGMAATWALSRKAIKAVISLNGDTPYFEDRYWKDHLEGNKRFKLHLRNSPNNNYHYIVHGKNTSSAAWLDKEWGKEQAAVARKEAANKEPPPLSLNSFQATKMAFSLLGRALPLLPKDIFMKFRSKVLS